MIEKIFLEFFQYCLDDSLPLPESSGKIDWKKIMTWAEQQAILGVIYGGIQNAGKNLNISFDELMEWIGYAQAIKNQNRILNKKCVDVISEYESAGFRCMVLKGQGNATMYPNPLLRMSGDIDVWIRTLSDGRCNKDEVVRYAKKKDAKAEVRFYHVEYVDDGVIVEAHFMPGIMNNPLYNHRLQSFYHEMAEKRNTEEVALPDSVGRIPVPSTEFNIFFQLAHMMHHFFDEGIGLRQFVDYYYLLKSVHGERLMFLGDVEETLKYLNLYKFAGAVMYIMKEVLGLDEKYLIVPVDDRRGKTLLNEILKGGNFGHHSGLDQKNALKKYFQKTWRNMQLVKEYPAEALCEPVFRTWHFFWRLAH